MQVFMYGFICSGDYAGMVRKGHFCPFIFFNQNHDVPRGQLLFKIPWLLKSHDLKVHALKHNARTTDITPANSPLACVPAHHTSL